MTRQVKIYVEGGGDHNKLKTECRRAFSKFFEKAGFKGRMPRIVACGGRQSAYDDFCSAMKQTKKTFPILLVDAEELIKAPAPAWHYLTERDKWNKPDGVTENQAHLMVVIMESWFLADPSALENFFGQHFDASALPNNLEIERIDKRQVLSCLENATRRTQKGIYGKGPHSFKVLATLNPKKVTTASPWALSLINDLDEILTEPV